MDTTHLVVYYPLPRQEEAKRIAGHLEGCLEQMRSKLVPGAARDKLVVMVPELPFNNAYVALSGAPHMVLPAGYTIGLFTAMGLPPDAGTIGCHEVVHYVQAQQVRGLYRGINFLLGEGAFNPQIGLESWFWEGLATYYESRLVPGAGRMASPAFKQTFASGIAHARMHPGLMHAYQRSVPMAGAYLIGAHFISFLVERYGEAKLWKVVDAQARSWLPPLRVSSRFSSAYGKSLGELFDEFETDTRRKYPPRTRPADQIVTQRLAERAELALARDGSQALVHAGADQVNTLVVLGPDGRERLRRELPDLMPPRKIHIGMIEGLSFSPDARQLYFTSFDLTGSSLETHLMRVDIGSGDVSIVRHNIAGTGGDVSNDGERYLFPHADGDRHELATIDLRSGELRVLAEMRPEAYVASPKFSPDGARVVAMVATNRIWDIWVLDAQSGEPLQRLTQGPTSHFDPSWVDDDHVVYTAEIDGRLQPMIHDLRTNATRQAADAPYVAKSPRTADGTSLWFLNRDGWKWTLDRVPLVLSAAPPPEAPAQVVEQAPPEGAQQPAATPPADQPAAAPPADEPAKPVEQPAQTAPAETPAPTDARAGEAVAQPLPTPPLDFDLPPPAPPVAVLTDRAYSQLDGLFQPRLRLPLLWWNDQDGLYGSLAMTGHDRLGFHAWAIEVAYKSRTRDVDGSISYFNGQLAPWALLLHAGEQSGPLAEPMNTTRREVTGRIAAGRNFYDLFTLTSFNVLGLRDKTDSGVVMDRRFIGPRLDLQASFLRGTAHAGARKGVGLALSGAVYPKAFDSTFQLTDGSATLLAAVPLPLSKRHSLRMTARGRVLGGVPDMVELMQIGGLSSASGLYSSKTLGEVSTNYAMPGAMTFSEPLRGYEDAPFLANRVMIGEASYVYPLIIDWGTASTLRLLPGLFFRQLDLEAFGTVATTFDNDRHGAVGGGVSLRAALWAFPLTVRYQVARRIWDDKDITHLITVALE